MAYQVLARKWRPRNFTQLVGQEHVSRSLCNALKHDRLHHAYLFTGTRGVGKTTVARILAKAINCETPKDSNPCGECSICIAFEEGRFLDLIEVDAASHTKVEGTRELLDNAQYAPHQGRYKVYLIDEVHMLSGHSFNALLKTLEEPPSHVKFLLATTDPQKIPVTVLSRCLQFNLKRLLPDQISNQMQLILNEEGILFDHAAIQLLARSADGSLRDGLSLLDQAIAFGNGKVETENVNSMLGIVAQLPVNNILHALADQNGVALLEKISEISELSPDFSDILQKIIIVLHRVALTQTIPGFVDQEFDVDFIATLSAQFSPEDVQLYYQIALMGQKDLNLAPDPKMGFEMVMLRMLAFKPQSLETSTIDTAVVSSNMQSPQSSNQPQLSESKVEKIGGQANVPQLGETTHDWRSLVVAMKVTGMTRELANNCVLEGIDESICALVLDSGHAQLQTPRATQKLEQALSDYLQRSIKLKINCTDTKDITPAQQNVQDQQNKQQLAVQSIQEDQTVKALKDQFDARVMPGTIEPIDNSNLE